ncbi:MAG TPA: flagellar basal body P-ring protein FlgI [Terracidiphilus sp.]|jgi:flagellar P-ring protein precursor FlgI|nr:flagellar basal body P-ring protein FlgI [Terracidiphilus sp.]
MNFPFAIAKFPLRTVALALGLCCAAPTLSLAANVPAGPNRQVLVRDITSVEGVRDNMLVGYGLVVGLARTGDSQQTYFTVQTLANAMQRMGVLISPGVVEVKNVAAVFITASLPPFARPGARLDITVSSAGDAKSLEGGVLLMSALHGPDGQVYAEAQGPLVVGGYSAGTGSNGKQVNSPTVGIVPNGGIVERDTAVDLHDFKVVSLLLRNPDFTTARQIADAINQDFHKSVANALDSTRVDVSVAEAAEASVPDLISRVQNLALTVHTPARIVVNERTGTIVLGGDVKLTPVSVIHGNLSIQVVTSYAVAPVPGAPVRNGPGYYGSGPRLSATPQGGSGAAAQNPPGQAPGADNVLPGQPAALVPETTVTADDGPAQTMRLDEGANVEELVNGLHALGTTSRDVISILQAIKAEGGLQAELEVQ